MTKVVPCMWVNGDAEEAANFYVSLVRNSEITHVQRNVADGRSGKEDSVLVVEFTVAGQKLDALYGGMKKDNTHALSLMQPVTETGQFASWISPPKVGIDNKPGDFEYVRIES